MEQIENRMNQIDGLLKEVIANPYVSAVIAIFFIMYAGLAAPKLPKRIALLFDYTIFKVLVLAGILILNRYNPTIALIVAIAFFITIQTLSRARLGSFMGQVAHYKRIIMNEKEEEMKASKDDERASAPVPAVAEDDIPEQVRIMSAPSAEDTEVSGLANRATEFESPQGLGGLQGFDGNIVGASL